MALLPHNKLELTKFGRSHRSLFSKQLRGSLALLAEVNSRKWRKSSRLSENEIVLTIVYQGAFLLFKSTLEQNLYFFIDVSLSMKSYGLTIYTGNC